MKTAILFYSPFCPLCPKVIEKCVAFFTQNRIPLLIKMPKVTEKQHLTGFPALYLPRQLGRLNQDYILIGSNIPDWLKDKEDLLHGN